MDINWNVVVTARGEGFTEAKRAMRRYGTVKPTHFFNVLLAQVGDIDGFLNDFSREYSRKPYLQDSISAIRPLMHTFVFNSREEFEVKLREIIVPWTERMKGKSFHVRIHRRGNHEFSALEEEKILDRFVLNEVQGNALVSFDDPDFVIDVETVDQEAGVSIWESRDLERCPFLKIS